MGLRIQAQKYRSGLKDKALYFRKSLNSVTPKDINNEPVLTQNDLTKQYLELYTHLTQATNLKELLDKTFAFFMNHTKSQQGMLFLKENNQWAVKINKNMDAETLKTNQIEEKNEIFLLPNKELCLPLKGKNSLLGWLVLNPITENYLKENQEVLNTFCFFTGLALENSGLESENQKQLKNFSTLQKIGQSLSTYTSIEEFMFLAFATLERGLKIKKMLLLAQNNEKNYTILDGIGCREETHHNFIINPQEEYFKTLPPQNPENLWDNNHIPWKQLLNQEDYDECNMGFFIPLKVKQAVKGYIVILKATDVFEDSLWNQTLFQLLGTYFSFALSKSESS